jgi:hypothetical protein
MPCLHDLFAACSAYSALEILAPPASLCAILLASDASIERFVLKPRSKFLFIPSRTSWPISLASLRFSWRIPLRVFAASSWAYAPRWSWRSRWG